MIARRLRAQLSAWRDDHARVSPRADEINLKRLRFLGATVAALNLLHVLALWWSAPTTPAMARWRAGLILTHVIMGALMSGAALLGPWAAKTGRVSLARALTMGASAGALGLSSVIAAIDQWVTPSITAFVASTYAIGFLVLLRPGASALIYLGNGALFVGLVGLTQGDASVLLSNRLGALGNTLLGWGLSVVLWRSFTALTLQQRAVEALTRALQERNAALHERARRDALTGLLNRAAAVELAEQTIQRAQARGRPQALLIMDLDHFKRVNDTWGHPAGDEALRQLAQRLQEALPEQTMVARLGGEEFLAMPHELPVSLPEALERARELGERVCAAVALKPLTWEGQAIPLTISVGVCVAPGQVAAPFARHYACADEALYRAKRAGRARVEVSQLSQAPRCPPGSSTPDDPS